MFELKDIAEVEKWPVMLRAMVRSNMYWPIFCGYLLWRWSAKGQFSDLFVIGFIVCFFIGLFYPYAWQVTKNRLAKKYTKLFDKKDKVCSELNTLIEKKDNYVQNVLRHDIENLIAGKDGRWGEDQVKKAIETMKASFEKYKEI